jgi:hypothetical protein
MKRTIYRIEDSNMAGFEWWYRFTLSRAHDRSLTLTLTQSARGANRLDIEPAAGLRTGVQVYEALSDMLSVAGYSLDERDLDEIAAEIAELDAEVAEQFRTAPEEIEKVEEVEAQAAAAHEQAILAPFAARISDDKLYYPGAGYVYPSRRHWMRLFLQQYVLAHSELPTGRHYIRVRGAHSYSGGEHDFSDLAAS